MYLPLKPADFAEVFLVARARTDADRLPAVLREAATLDPVRSDNGLTVVPTDTFDTLKYTDIVVVPGSSRWRDLLKDSGGNR